ncbi:hypothetical protein [Streptomyces geysiriensis]|uniref:hypothetical protein n=1 Tax=Streptomyces geysiriensis TaxID=68207 RepID=UPI0027DEF36D|nr:hypothetical protein [Streptomyces geysiriensis]
MLSIAGEGVEVFVKEHVAFGVCQADLYGPWISERGGLHVQYDQAAVGEDAARPSPGASVVGMPGGGPTHRPDGIVQAGVLFPERLHVPVSAGVVLSVDGAQVAGVLVHRPGGPLGVAGPYEADVGVSWFRRQVRETIRSDGSSNTWRPLCWSEGGAAVSQTWKITVIVLAAVGVLSTPLIWLLDSPGAGQLAGATVQAAVGIAALVWALFQRPPSAGPTDKASRTGKASRGGVTGIRRPGARGRGSATAERTGEASGTNSVSGIDYSN